MGFNIEEFDFISFYPRSEEYISNLQQFIVIFKELLLCMDNKDKEYWCESYISSDIPILVRSALLILRHIPKLTGKEKLELLKSNNIKILDINFKEELFWLYADIFPSLDDNDKRIFLDEIMNEEKLDESIKKSGLSHLIDNLKMVYIQ